MIKWIKENIFPFYKYDFKKCSYFLLLVTYVIGFIGVYLIAVLQDSDENLYQKQIIAYAAGLLVIIVCASIDYHLWAKLYIVIFLVGIVLLLICKYSNSLPIYGWSHYDARRWIKIGGDPTLGEKNEGFEFMPSELTKIAIIIFVSAFFNKCRKHIKKFWVLLLAIIFVAVPIYQIFDQPDFSTTVVMLGVFAVMVLISGVSYKYIIPAIAVGVPLLYAAFWYVQQDFQWILDEYQQKRILAALHPEMYPELMYQQTNAELAIRSGGMIGKTFAGVEGIRGTAYVPVVESDFIFSAVAEEFGFLGSIFVLALYFIMILLIIKIARNAVDYLGMMMAVGFGTLIMLQVFINIGVVSSLLPNTGLTLPYMSSGLSSLLVNLAMTGILLNISLQRKKPDKNKTDNDELGFINV